MFLIRTRKCKAIAVTVELQRFLFSKTDRVFSTVKTPRFYGQVNIFLWAMLAIL